LAAALVEAYRDGERSCFGQLFMEVDALILAGDHAVAELVVVGLLEDLQGELLRDDLDLDAFRRWMGPEAVQAWNDLLVFWEAIRVQKESGELPLGLFEHGLPEVKDPKLRRILRRSHRPFR
jgi:hypothetical protein